jgi:hypothetical protein
MPLVYFASSNVKWMLFPFANDLDRVYSVTEVNNLCIVQLKSNNLTFDVDSLDYYFFRKYWVWNVYGQQFKCISIIFHEIDVRDKQNIEWWDFCRHIELLSLGPYPTFGAWERARNIDRNNKFETGNMLEIIYLHHVNSLPTWSYTMLFHTYYI